MASPTGDDDTDTNFSFTSDHIEDQPTSVGAGGAWACFRKRLLN